LCQIFQLTKHSITKEIATIQELRNIFVKNKGKRALSSFRVSQGMLSAPEKDIQDNK
jgi:hypothetical protein